MIENVKMIGSPQGDANDQSIDTLCSSEGFKEVPSVQLVVYVAIRLIFFTLKYTFRSLYTSNDVYPNLGGYL